MRINTDMNLIVENHEPFPSATAQWRIVSQEAKERFRRMGTSARPMYVAIVHDMELAKLFAASPQMQEALRGCVDALREAGKDFAIHNPLAKRPNLHELHADKALEALALAELP